MGGLRAGAGSGSCVSPLGTPPRGRGDQRESLARGALTFYSPQPYWRYWGRLAGALLALTARVRARADEASPQTEVLAGQPSTSGIFGNRHGAPDREHSPQSGVSHESAAKQKEETMNGLIYLIGLIVVILFVLSFLGLR
jgi:hypothetical protein